MLFSIYVIDRISKQCLKSHRGQIIYWIIMLCFFWLSSNNCQFISTNQPMGVNRLVVVVDQEDYSVTTIMADSLYKYHQRLVICQLWLLLYVRSEAILDEYRLYRFISITLYLFLLYVLMHFGERVGFPFLSKMGLGGRWEKGLFYSPHILEYHPALCSHQYPFLKYFSFTAMISTFSFLMMWPFLTVQEYRRFFSQIALPYFNHSSVLLISFVIVQCPLMTQPYRGELSVQV